MSDLRYAAIAALLKGMRLTRLDRLAAPWLSGRGVIFTLHHVCTGSAQPFEPNRILEITPGFLDRVIRLVRADGYEIVPLGEVPARLAGEGPPFVVLTFDDGYRDNLTEALPVLRRQGAPFTLYCVPGFADATAPLWWRDLEEVVRRAGRLEVPYPEGPVTYPASTAEEKRAAFNTIYWRLRNGPEPVLREAIATMAGRAGIAPLQRVAELCLDWDGLADVARDPLCTIGAHTMTHPMLARHPEAVARHEIAESRRMLAARLGVAVDHLSYPVGDPAAAGAREFAMARAEGFTTAVTTRPGVLTPAHRDHLMALPRISLNGLFQTEGEVRSLLSGLPTALQNRFRRLNVA
jgi:peptidoglycan/xylan/chitin deacetylase (PgdA/CDA1 family)